MIYYIKELYRRYIDDEVPAYGAEMAYYFLLSVFPFLIFLTTILGYLPVTEDDIMGQLVNVLPYETYELVRENVEYLMQHGISGSVLWVCLNSGRHPAVWALL